MNETSIAEAGNSYRRGVIFGLTMAEILLLLIFCLLLFMATLDEKIEELTKFNETLESQNLEYLRENKILLAQNARYKENIDNKNESLLNCLFLRDYDSVIKTKNY